jgi:hypothetical protein
MNHSFSRLVNKDYLQIIGPAFVSVSYFVVEAFCGAQSRIRLKNLRLVASAT